MSKAANVKRAYINKNKINKSEAVSINRKFNATLTIILAVLMTTLNAYNFPPEAILLPPSENCSFMKHELNLRTRIL